MIAFLANAIIKVFAAALWGICYLTLAFGGTVMLLQALVFILLGIHHATNFINRLRNKQA